MRVRKFLGFSVAALLLLIDRLATFLPLRKYYKKGFIDLGQFTENIIVGDYTSALHIAVICMIIFIFVEEYVNEYDIGTQLIRYGDIGAWYKERIFHVDCVACILSIIYVLIELIFCIIFGDIKLALKHGLYEALFVQGIVISLYLIMIWLLSECIKTICSQIVSKIIILVSVTLFYFVFTHIIDIGNINLNFLEIIKKYCIGICRLIDCIKVVIVLFIVDYTSYKILLYIRRRQDIWV